MNVGAHTSAARLSTTQGHRRFPQSLTCNRFSPYGPPTENTVRIRRRGRRRDRNCRKCLIYSARRTCFPSLIDREVADAKRLGFTPTQLLKLQRDFRAIWIAIERYKYNQATDLPTDRY